MTRLLIQYVVKKSRQKESVFGNPDIKCAPVGRFCVFCSQDAERRLDLVTWKVDQLVKNDVDGGETLSAAKLLAGLQVRIAFMDSFIILLTFFLINDID